MSYSAVFEEAFAIVKMQPLPDNAEQRLKALEKQVLPKEKAYFAELWEGFYMDQMDACGIDSQGRPVIPAGILKKAEKQ